jgi:hypothetical protein
MSNKIHRFVIARPLQLSVAGGLILSGMSGVAVAGDHDFRTTPGNLLLSRTVYDNNAANVSVGASLPPNCATANCVAAQYNGTYPFVFNNAPIDGSFGITSKILLDELTTRGETISSFEVPNSTQRRVNAHSDQMVTSFSSKSELALHLSTDRQHVTFMGYLAPIDALDVSNSNTPAVIDPTNPVPNAYYRVVADLDTQGEFRFTATNAYSGNNGRAAIMHNSRQETLIFTAGNAGNGANPQPTGVLLGAGAQGLAEATTALFAQAPGLPTPVASFNITEIPANAKTDKIGKDDNFRGLTIFNNVLYYTKGSGGNGIDTVYFVDTSGTDSSGKPLACPKGTGIPAASATLPTAPLTIPSTLATTGLPSNMCVLNGFNTTLAKTSTNAFPFGLWFANATTLYVADEGDGTNTYDASTGVYIAAAASTTAGLQKWVFNATLGQWQLTYTLQKGLNLGAPYTVAGYPTGNNLLAKTNYPWSPATDGLRNLTGRVNRDGTVTIWAITSTVSGSGDQGADPNKLVEITDSLSATTLPAQESFKTVKTSAFAEVLRGVSFTPGTDLLARDDDDWRHHDHNDWRR